MRDPVVFIPIILGLLWFLFERSGVPYAIGSKGSSFFTDYVLWPIMMAGMVIIAPLAILLLPIAVMAGKIGIAVAAFFIVLLPFAVLSILQYRWKAWLNLARWRMNAAGIASIFAVVLPITFASRDAQDGIAVMLSYGGGTVLLLLMAWIVERRVTKK